MIEFVRDTALYDAVRRLSANSKRVWAASPYLGRGARNVFDPSFMSATDTRLLVDLKSGYVDKVELAAFRTWAPKGTRTLRYLHAKIYVFDKSAIITSANLSRRAFERNREIGLVFTGTDASRARSAFFALYKKGKPITAAGVKALKPKKITFAGHGGGDDGATDQHTWIDIWDEGKATEAGEQTTAESHDVAGPTCECDYQFTKLTNQRIDVELKRRGLQRIRVFSPGQGLKAARDHYRVGALFDVSWDIGSKKANWTKGARRHLGIVKAVFAIPGYTLVAYRTMADYRIDAVLIKAAKAFHVYSGHPKFDELIKYRRRVEKRKKAIATKKVH